MDLGMVLSVDLVNRRSGIVVMKKVTKSSSRSRTPIGVAENARTPRKYLWRLSESSSSEQQVHTRQRVYRRILKSFAVTGEVVIWIKVVMSWQRRGVGAVQKVIDILAIEARQHLTLHETRCEIIVQVIDGQKSAHSIIRKILHLLCGFAGRWVLPLLRLVCGRSFFGI